MTYKNYIEATLAKFGVGETEVQLICIDNGIKENHDVDVAVAKKAIHKSLSIWLPVHTSISEGGVSESWNYDAVKIFYGTLCNELGLENAVESHSSTIKDRSNIW